MGWLLWATEETLILEDQQQFKVCKYSMMFNYNLKIQYTLHYFILYQFIYFLLIFLHLCYRNCGHATSVATGQHKLDGYVPP